MIAPTANDVGRYVVYQGHRGAEPATGVIHSVPADGRCFVRYGPGVTPQLTPVDRLEWATVDKPLEARIIDDILGAE